MVQDSSKGPDTGPENQVQAGADQEIDFVTLGMFIIDEIEFPPPNPPVRDVLGGAGSYSALGARLFSPPPLSKSVGWIVDQGSDFPPSISLQINTWETSALFRYDPSRLTTRGWNGYTSSSSSSSSQHRAFRYTTPKKRLTAADLSATLLQAKAIHLICSPLRCQELVASILARRKEAAAAAATAYHHHHHHHHQHHLSSDASHRRCCCCCRCDSSYYYTRPLIVWEPVPDRCVPDELLNCTNTLPLVDVCSPNDAELAGFMGSSSSSSSSSSIGIGIGGDVDGNDANDDDDDAVERHCEQLLASMPLQSYTLVVRAGRRGCYIARNGGRKKKEEEGAEKAGAGAGTGRKKKRKDYVRGGLQPDTDVEALFAGLLRDEEGCVAREEIEIDPGIEKWVPAYYGEGYRAGNDGDGQDGDGKVVDPTGGGNTFLGGLAVALARGKSIEESCVWGHVAASFAIEQVGFPVLSVDGEGRETWNGVRVDKRLQEFQERL